jgi:hypothetical protein
MRVHAAALGMGIDEVRRDLPYFSARHVLEEVSADWCIRYSLARRGPGPRVLWNLLQRGQAQGAQFPNGFLLVAEEEIPRGLRDCLHDVAMTYDEDLFEFAGTEDEVIVYWSEWGGVRQVDEVAKTLDALAAY